MIGGSMGRRRGRERGTIVRREVPMETTSFSISSLIWTCKPPVSLGSPAMSPLSTLPSSNRSSNSRKTPLSHADLSS